jgi:hypothetical protein
MGEHDVVVLGEEARRSGRLGIRPRSVGEVEELPPARVAEDAEARSQPFHDLA